MTIPTAEDWPELTWQDFEPTASTLHLWTQIVGKTRLFLTPRQNHWWNVPLYVTPRGLTTSAMPVLLDGVQRSLDIEFDFLDHELVFQLSNGIARALPLRPQSVADFFSAYQQTLAELGLNIRIHPMPVEMANPVRFELDHVNASYDPVQVHRFHRILVSADTVLKRFATGFQGKISPVHFFWGSFDLCCTRFSGRLADGPAKPDPMQQEAYSHEVISAGFWPGNGGFGEAAFYCYAAPVPAGLAGQAIAPGAWNDTLGEFILRYDDVRMAADPARTLLDFLESSYAAAANSACWNRSALERPMATAPAST